MREEDLTLQILDMLRAYGFPAWRTHNTRHYPVEPGIADINAVLPGGIFFACEVKKPGEYTKPFREQKQAEWLKRVADQGGVVCKVRNLEEAQNILKTALAIHAGRYGGSSMRTSHGG